MSTLARHAGSGVKHGLSEVAGIVDGSVALSPNLAKLIAFQDGSYSPSLGATLGATPSLEFRTRDLDFLAAPTEVSGLLVSSRAYDSAGGLSSSYISYTISNGLMFPVRISGNQGGAAELSIRVIPISSDGDTFPIAVGTTSIDPGLHGDAYTIGDVSLGSAVAAVQSIDFDFGISARSNAGENGKPFPTQAWTESQQSTLSVTTAALAEASANRINTGQSVSASISAVFRKLVEGGVPSGSYTLTMAKALVEVGQLSNARPCTLQIAAAMIHDGTNYVQFA